MARKTIYNKNLTSQETWGQVLPSNKELLSDFLMYKKGSNRSGKTIEQYEAMLRIFFTWNSENNNNVFFIDIKKKHIVRFMFYMTDELKYSPNRVATVKSAISSLGNFIETVLADEYPLFRNPMRGIEAAAKTPIREKTVISEEMAATTLDSLTNAGLYQVAAYFACALASGARKAELIQFKTEYFSDQAKVLGGCAWKTKPIRTKGRGTVGKVISKFVFVSQFEPYLNLWLEQRSREGINSEWLFISNGHQATVNNATTWSKTISRHMGADFYPHACRHYWTTNLKKQQLPDDVIIALTGWEKKSGAAMVATYNDQNVEETFDKYFDENGIKIIK